MTGVVEEAIATANSSAVSATGAASCGPRSALADWRVPDLRNECKKRQLIVSGAKPVLLERLRPFEAGILADAASATEQPPLDPTPPAACSVIFVFFRITAVFIESGVISKQSLIYTIVKLTNFTMKVARFTAFKILRIYVRTIFFA
jgi:hypothetical protein